MIARRALLLCCCLPAWQLLAPGASASGRGRARASATAARCFPTALNRSAVLRGAGLAASPLPGSYDASPRTQISLLGAPASSLGGVRVRGSRSGTHAGRLIGYSQGDGASFVPSRPFASGERVTVSGRARIGSRTTPFAYSFVVGSPDALPYSAPRLPSGRDPNEVQHFVSRPDLQPPALLVTARSPRTAPGYVFAAPYSGPGKPGPMIFDDAGTLVWFDPMPAGTESANLQVQQYGGQPVLTWWQGYIPQQGFGEGEHIILNSSYRQIGSVHAGNGYKADLHDLQITPQGTALITIFAPVHCNLATAHGRSDAAVTDSGFQEIDIRTGLVRREWRGLDHVPFADSYLPGANGSTEWPFDFIHVNSVDRLANGGTLISARNTSAIYELNTLTGQVVRRLGGKHSDLGLPAGAATAFQHDAAALASGAISIFDNGAVPKVHAQSRGLVVNVSAATETVLAQYLHPSPLSSASQGNLQVLDNGDAFIGWGSQPYFSEFSAAGELLFDAHMRGSYQSYRAYRFPWTGAGSERPAVVATRPRAGGSPTVYASWNGDTRTAAWRVLAGPSTHQLVSVATAPRTGFETAIGTAAPAAYVAVQALGASGEVLAGSAAVAPVAR